MHFFRVTDHWAGCCTGGRFPSDHKNAERLKSVKLLKLVLLVDIVKQVISVTPVRRANSANIVKPVGTRTQGGVRHLPDCVHRPCYGTADTYSWGDTSLIERVIKTSNYKF